MRQGAQEPGCTGAELSLLVGLSSSSSNLGWRDPLMETRFAPHQSHQGLLHQTPPCTPFPPHPLLPRGFYNVLIFSPRSCPTTPHSQLAFFSWPSRLINTQQQNPDARGRRWVPFIRFVESLFLLI